MLRAQSALRSNGSRPALAAGYFAYFCVVGVYTPYISLWLAAQGHSALVIGQLLALASGLRIFGPFAVAWLFDHAQSRRGWFVVAAAAALCTWGVVAAWPWLGGGSAPTIALLALAFAFYSLSFNSLMSAYDAFVLDCLGKEQRDYGQLRWWGSAGFILSSTLLGQWLAVSGANVVLWGLLLSLAAMVVCFLRLPQDPPRTVAPAPAGAVAAALRQPLLWVFVVVGFLQQAGFGAYYTFFSLYLQQHGYGSRHIGLLWAWGVVAEISVFLAGPWLVARLRLRTLLQLALLGTALRWVLLGATVDNVALTWLGQTLHLAGFALFHTVGVLLLPRLLPPGAAARAQALSGSFGWGLGGMAGSLFAAVVWNGVGPAGAFYASAVLALAAAVLAWVGLRGPLIERIDPAH
jgi:PPP family 3-phenylpropionic acid transporter